MHLAYLLVVAVLVSLLSAWTGYGHGIDVERGRAALDLQAAIVVTHQAAHQDAEIESSRRIAAALRNAGQAAASRAAKLKGQLNAARADARPDCRWPDDRVRDISASIAAANADPDAATDGMPDPVPAAAGPH